MSAPADPFPVDPARDAWEAAVSGVQAAFTHLSRAAITNPPHEWFDAALARQCAIHLSVNVFNVPKRRVTEMQGRSREAVNRALATVDARLFDLNFARAYDRMEKRASSEFGTLLLSYAGFAAVRSKAFFPAGGQHG